ncbi:heterokaryon incompatibility protein-domain-containing protein [Xylariaceae sp. FL1019]|nr:heterokaryon incompatibility protein-domain-containing protein [Xylariaceae sp. FL1019]
MGPTEAVGDFPWDGFVKPFIHRTITMTSQFQHRPLSSSRYIRVLDLLPGRKREAPIECRVRELDLDYQRNLDYHRNYEALSYVWGERTGSLPIRCDGLDLLVTPNCHDALVHLRRSVKVRTLWIDSICLNQSEDESGLRERAEQIPRMGEIFGRARCVVIWLGVGDDLTPRVFRYLGSLRYLGNLRSSKRPLMSKACSIAADRMPILFFGHRTVANTKYWKTLALLFDNQWFTRAWTVQEFVVAQKQVVMCGTSVTSWDGVAWGAASAPGGGDPIHASAESIMVRAVWLGLALGKADDRGIRYGDWDSLSWLDQEKEFGLLVSMRNNYSTIPHDKVYGLYSLLHASGIDLPAPDYGKPATQVFEETALAHVQSRRKLNILTIGLPADEVSGTLSWVPDWMDDGLRYRWDTPDSTGMAFFQSTYMGYRNGYMASGQSKTAVYRHTAGTLTVQGRFMGDIQTKLASTPIGIEDVENMVRFRDFMSKTCLAWVKLIDSMEAHPTGHDPDTVAIGTILFHFRNMGQNTTVERHFPNWLDVMRHANNIDNQTKLMKGSDEHIVFGSSIEDRIPREVQQKVNELANYAMLSLSSGYLGIAFHTCQEGDRLALLAGSDVPFLLRPRGNAFRVVAPAYVHGMMQGELWPENEDGLEDITLV